jgi:hypothetical protein
MLLPVLLSAVLTTAAVSPALAGAPWMVPHVHAGDRLYIVSNERGPTWDKAHSLFDFIMQGAYDFESVDDTTIAYVAHEPAEGPATLHGSLDLAHLIDKTDDPGQPPDGTEFDMPVYSPGFYGMLPANLHEGSTWKVTVPAWDFGPAATQTVTATKVNPIGLQLSLVVHGEGAAAPADPVKQQVWSDGANAFIPLKFSHVDWTLNVTFINGLLNTCDIVMHTKAVSDGRAPYRGENWDTTYSFYETAIYVPAALNRARPSDNS